MDHPSTDALILQGQEHASNGDLKKARRAFSTAIKQCRQDADADPQQLAALYDRIGLTLMDAFRELAKPLPGAVSRVEFEEHVKLQERALLYPDAAVEYFREAVQIAPDSAEYQVSLGEACHEAGHRDEAIAACRRGLELHPAWPEAQALLGAMLLDPEKDADNHEAARLLTGAAAARPDDIHIRRRLLDALAMTHQVDVAVQEFVRFVRAWPEWTQIHYDVAERCTQIAGGSLFQHAFERALATPADASSSDYNYGLGLVCQSVGDQDTAIRAYRAGIALDPQFAPLLYNLGNALRAIDEPDESIEWLEKSVALSKTLAEPHFPLGVLYMQRDRAKAREHLNRFLELAPPYAASAVSHARMLLKVL